MQQGHAVMAVHIKDMNIYLWSVIKCPCSWRALGTPYPSPWCWYSVGFGTCACLPSSHMREWLAFFHVGTGARSPIWAIVSANALCPFIVASNQLSAASRNPIPQNKNFKVIKRLSGLVVWKLWWEERQFGTFPKLFFCRKLQLPSLPHCLRHQKLRQLTSRILVKRFQVYFGHYSSLLNTSNLLTGAIA